MKCAVCAASPTRTIRPSCHVRLRTVTKLVQSDRFERSRWPARSSAKSRSQYAMLSASVASSRPARRQTSPGHSTMKVLVRPSNGYAWTWNRPCSFSRKTNVNAGKTRSVPNHAYFVVCTSSVGPNASSPSRRRVLFTPSAPTTRSYPPDAVEGRHLRLESKIDAERRAPALQDAEQLHARDRGERVPARAESLAAIPDVDRRPTSRRCR